MWYHKYVVLCCGYSSMRREWAGPMVKIALCDNECSAREELQTLLDQYNTQRRQEMDTTAYCSSLELLAAMDRGARFDVLLLGILLPGQNGIETAAEIRQHDRDVKIIFLTSSRQFALEAYGVNACQYLLKPIQAASFFPVLDFVFETCEREQVNGFLLRCKGGIVRVEPRRVEYCEVNSRKLLIHMASGQVWESVGRMGELLEHLSLYGGFLQVHRSYFVNMDYIQQLSYRAVVMSCMAEIPVPRGKYNEIKDVFLQYAARNGQVLL